MIKQQKSNKEVDIKNWNSSKKCWMTENEFVEVVVVKTATNSEYVISDGVIEPNGFIPGDWAEDFMVETSRQVKSGKTDLELIEEKFGVVYL